MGLSYFTAFLLHVTLLVQEPVSRYTVLPSAAFPLLAGTFSGRHPEQAGRDRP
jgi:hypothetical protein